MSVDSAWPAPLTISPLRASTDLLNVRGGPAEWRAVPSPGVRVIRESNGDDSLELPLPSTYLVDRGGFIRQAFVDADYTHRAEPSTILAWIDALDAD